MAIDNARIHENLMFLTNGITGQIKELQCFIVCECYEQFVRSFIA